MRFGPGDRICFGKDSERLVILSGGAGLLGGLQATKETGDSIMPLTHGFKDTIRARAQRDPDFRPALLYQAVECILNGDLETGKAVLRR